jgi:type III pantothenate kinase
VSGVQNGIIFEIDYYIKHFVKQFPSLITVLTGGDVNFLVNRIEKFTFAEPNLVFIGLMKIIEFNTHNK